MKKKIFLLSIFAGLFLFTTFLSPSVYSQGTFSCVGLSDNKACVTLINNCDPDYEDDCANYTYHEGDISSCPMETRQCFPKGTVTLTPHPTLAPPTPTPYGKCGDLGEPCCGKLFDFFCNPPYVPSNPSNTNCECVNPPTSPIPTPTPTPGPNCGNLEEPCCGLKPSLYCFSPYVPSDPSGEDTYCLCLELPDSPFTPSQTQYEICQGNEQEVKECKECFDKGGGGKWAWTALGCIPTDPTELIKWAFPYLLGFGGLAAFLLIVFAGIQIMTSSGNPEKLKAGKELITSAVMGLIFIILSLFLLRVVSVDILHIPGLE